MIWVLTSLLWLAAFGLTRAAYRAGHLKTPWHRDVAGLALLGLATLGFFWRVVTGQNWMPADGGDLVSFLFPTYRFAAQTIRGGAWPLWNPFLYAGAPHVGDIQAGFLYPPNLLLFLLWPDFPYSALQWLSIGHIWFAGAGMYLLLVRGLGVRRVAAFSGSLAFMFSDAFITHFGNLNFNAVAGWLPWVFWAFAAHRQSREWANQRINESANQRINESANQRINEWASRRGRALAARSLARPLLAGVLLAVATLAGHIQATLFILLALAIYTGLRLWLERDESDLRAQVTSAVLSLLGCLLVTCLLAAPVLLPALELAGYTARSGWNYTQAAGYSLSPAQLIGWLVPGFFGRGPQFHWGAWPRVEVGYLGILPLVLAGVALGLRRDRQTWAWTGLAAGSFILALGIYAIPHGWLTLVPGFGQLRAPARLVLLTDFAIATLAALGLDVLLGPLAHGMRAAFEKVWRLVAYATAAVLGFGVPLAYLALLLTQDRDPAITLRVSITLIAVVTFAGLLLASLLWLTARRGGWARSTTLGWLAAGLILLDVASLGAYQDLGNADPSAGFRQPAIPAFLAGQPGPFRIDTRTGIEKEWQPDTALLYGIEDVGGVVNPSALADASRFWEGLGSRSSPLYDLLNIRYVIARKDVTLDWNKFALAFDGDPRLNVYLNRRALPRAFLVGQVQAVGSHEEAWQAIHTADFDPARRAVVEGAAPQGGGQGEVISIRSAANRLEVRVSTNGPTLLVISQIWYPGWRVWIDGRSAGQPLRVNYAFQGVELPPGEHSVELRFLPGPWRLGWVLAGGTALGILIGTLAIVLRRPYAIRRTHSR